MRREGDTFVSDFKSQLWTLMRCLSLMSWSFEITVEFDNTTQQSNLYAFCCTMEWTDIVWIETHSEQFFVYEAAWLLIGFWYNIGQQQH